MVTGGVGGLQQGVCQQGSLRPVAVLNNQTLMGKACGHTAICETIYRHTCITVYLKKNYIFSLLQN